MAGRLCKQDSLRLGAGPSEGPQAHRALQRHRHRTECSLCSQPKAPSSRKLHGHPVGPWPTPSLCLCLDSGIQGLAPADRNEGAEHGVGTRLEIRELAQRAKDSVLTLHKLPAAWEDAAPFHCDPCRVFRIKGHMWNWRVRELECPCTEKKQGNRNHMGQTGSLDPTSVQD